MVQTGYGSLTVGLDAQPGQTLPSNHHADVMMRGRLRMYCGSPPAQSRRSAMRTASRTALEPLEALIIGSYVRGLSDRDIESLTVEAGLGQVSKTTVSRICRELRDRYRAFCSKSLADVSLLVLFLDAVYLPTRPP